MYISLYADPVSSGWEWSLENFFSLLLYSGWIAQTNSDTPIQIPNTNDIIAVQSMLMSHMNKANQILLPNSKLTAHSVSQIVCSPSNFPNKHVKRFLFSHKFYQTTLPNVIKDVEFLHRKRGKKWGKWRKKKNYRYLTKTLHTKTLKIKRYSKLVFICMRNVIRNILQKKIVIIMLSLNLYITAHLDGIIIRFYSFDFHHTLKLDAACVVFYTKQIDRIEKKKKRKHIHQAT